MHSQRCGWRILKLHHHRYYFSKEKKCKDFDGFAKTGRPIHACSPTVNKGRKAERAVERAHRGCARGGQSWERCRPGVAHPGGRGLGRGDAAHLLVANMAPQLSPNKAD